MEQYNWNRRKTFEEKERRHLLKRLLRMIRYFLVTHQHARNIGLFWISGMTAELHWRQRGNSLNWTVSMKAILKNVYFRPTLLKLQFKVPVIQMYSFCNHEWFNPAQTVVIQVRMVQFSIFGRAGLKEKTKFHWQPKLLDIIFKSFPLE